MYHKKVSLIWLLNLNFTFIDQLKERTWRNEDLRPFGSITETFQMKFQSTFITSTLRRNESNGHQSAVYSDGQEAFHPRVRSKALLAPNVLRCHRGDLQDIPERSLVDHLCMRASLIWGLDSLRFLFWLRLVDPLEIKITLTSMFPPKNDPNNNLFQLFNSSSLLKKRKMN